MAGQRRVNGVEAMIVDTTSLSVMVQSIGIPNKDGEKVSTTLFEYVVLFLNPFLLHIHWKELLPLLTPHLPFFRHENSLFWRCVFSITLVQKTQLWPEIASCVSGFWGRRMQWAEEQDMKCLNRCAYILSSAFLSFPFSIFWLWSSIKFTFV